MGENKNKWYSTPEFISAASDFATSTAGFLGRYKTADEMIHDAGTSYGSGPGFTYLRYNPIDIAAQKSEYAGDALGKTLKTTASGAALGSSIAPGIGTAIGAVGGLLVGGIGSLFGANSLRKQYERAVRRLMAVNNANYSGGMTEYLQQNETPLYNDNNLISAYRGKDASNFLPKYKYGKSVHTSAGKMNAPADAMVDYGESILDNLDSPMAATGHLVKSGKGKRDSNYANVNDDTVILGNDIDMTTGVSFKKLGAPLTNMLEQINKKFGTTKANNKFRGRLGQKTDELQQMQVARMKKPIVDKLASIADRQKAQHQLMSMYLSGPIAGMNRYAIGKDGDEFKEELKKALGITDPVASTTGDIYIPKTDLKPEEELKRILGIINLPRLTLLPQATLLDNDFNPEIKGIPLPKNPNKLYFPDSNRIERIPARDAWVYSLPGVMTGIGQYITAKTSKPKSVDIYAPNRYLPGALQRLSQMRINAQPLIDEAVRQSRMARYNALQSGGLTAGQRWLDNVVKDAQTADAIAKIRRDVQMQNNAYSTAYAQAAIAAGQDEAKQRQTANQYNEEYFARAHAARQAGMNAGLYNMIANIQQMGKNQFQRRMFNSNLGLWQQELDNKRMELLNR